jgi:replicative DNA helicase
MTKKDTLSLDLDYFERIIIYNALTDQYYLETILEYVDPDFFKDKRIQIIFKILKNFYNQHKVIPNTTELKAHLITPEQKDALKELAISFNAIDKSYNKELLIKNTEKFLREKSVISTVMETTIDAQSGNMDSASILKKFEKACSISLIDDIGFDYLEEIDKHCEDLNKVFNTLSTGWKWLDTQIGGGFMSEGRALYVFFGVTNVGKSIFLGNIGTNILNQDKTVVLISLEMPEQVYAKRISAQLSKIPCDDLKLQTSSLRKFVNEYKVKNKNSKLIVKEFPPKTVTVLNIKSYINKLIKNGIKPDAIIIDYINLIAPSENGLSSYESIKQITENLRALSYDFSCPIISATQSNRSGYGDSAPKLEATSESMGLSHTVDVQMSIWTEEGDSDLGIIHLGVEKNRFGPREVYTHLNIDYPTLSLTEPDDLDTSLPTKKSPQKLIPDVQDNTQEYSNVVDTFSMFENLKS